MTVGETAVVSVPPGDGVLSSTWLNSVLENSPEWPHGSIRVLNAARIGVDHGMSGRIHRVLAQTDRGGSRSLVVKEETLAAVARELLFRSECGELARGLIPDRYGGVVDVATQRGVLLLEDVTPSVQGDVLRGCDDESAKAVLRVLARLHSGTWKATDDAYPASLPRWGARPMERGQWQDRLALASERFPQILTRAASARIGDLPERVAPALADLRRGPVSWLQVDTHLDNVLWRSDGTVVLLDWCNAAIGPLAADVTRFLSEGIDAESRAGLVGAYVRELQHNGVDAELSDVEVALESALLPVLQGAVGWAGRGDSPTHGRPAEACESFLRSVVDWVLSA